MRKQKVASFIIIVLIIATIAFIWSNSLQSVPESQAESLGFLNKVKPFLEIFVGHCNVTDHLVRKLAHFTEFGIFGCGLALLLIFRGRTRLQSVVNCAFGGLIVALIDETIQIFTGRGSQVQDVWLDFSGIATGVVFVLIVYWIMTVIHKKQRALS